MTTTLGRVLARHLRRGLHDLVGPAGPAEQGARGTFTAAVNVGATEVEIFDRPLKRLHRDRSAATLRVDDPLQAAITENLLDRLEDCKRQFPVAAILGGAGEVVLRQLQGGRGGIEKVLLLDSSQAMLDRVQRHVQASSGDVPAVEYIIGDAEDVPLEEESVDREALLPSWTSL